eukprot:scaffold2790_cov239-Pinguiococcus_pyrenoidosus.AAC.8
MRRSHRCTRCCTFGTPSLAEVRCAHPLPHTRISVETSPKLALIRSRTLDGRGEGAYYRTCVGAVVDYVMAEGRSLASQSADGEEDSTATERDEAAADDDMDEWTPEAEKQAMQTLGEWLGAQKAMEDTIETLQQDGWMA